MDLNDSLSCYNFVIAFLNCHKDLEISKTSKNSTVFVTVLQFQHKYGETLHILSSHSYTLTYTFPNRPSRLIRQFKTVEDAIEDAT